MTLKKVPRNAEWFGPGCERRCLLAGLELPGVTSLLATPGHNGIHDAVKVLYLEDDRHDVELLQLSCQQDEPDCEITAVETREAYIEALKSGRYVAILSDSGVFDLSGPEAVKLARQFTPSLPYVFYCGTMADSKRADLLAAKPDGIFSKDRPEDAGLAIALLRKLSGER